jgi:hypothetical protein
MLLIKNNSAKNQHLIWMKTITVLLDNGNGSISYNSFVIAIGSKGNLRKDVEQLYADDLRKRSEPNKYFFGMEVPERMWWLLSTLQYQYRIDLKGTVSTVHLDTHLPSARGFNIVAFLIKFDLWRHARPLSTIGLLGCRLMTIIL